MYRKIKIINDVVFKFLKENNIDINDYKIDDCIKLLRNTNILECFDKVFKDINTINEKDISFYSDFVCDLIKIYLENTGIKIIEEDFIQEYKTRGKTDNNLNLYLRDIEKYPILSPKQEKEILRTYKEFKDQESKDIIICSNQRLILKYALKKTDNDSDLLDLIQEGNLALLETLEKFKLSYNCRFSTCACWYIRRDIDMAIIAKENIRKPKYVAALEKRINAYCYTIEQQQNRKPTEKELCEVFNIKLELLRNTMKDFTTTSLNKKLNDDSEEEIIEFVKDENNNFVKELERKELYKILMEEMSNDLTPEMLDMVIKKHGLYDGEKWTLEKIGKFYNISKQAVGVKIETAYRRVRKSGKLKKIIEN